MATAWDKLEQLLTCAICLDRFRIPKMLPCQHSFCQEPCMEGLQDYARRQIKCPECRAEHRIPFQGLQSYPTNVTLQRFLELHQSITGEEPEPVPSMMERCGVCSEKSTVTRCSHCEKKVCSECKEAHIDILKREISRICHQVRRALNRLQDALSQTERSMERLNVNSVHIRDEIEEIVRRFVKDLKSQEDKMLKDLETYSQVESKNLAKLKEDLEIEHDFLKDNCDLVEKNIVDPEKCWNDIELCEVKFIFVKTLDFLRNFDADAADYTRGMKFLPVPELETLRRNVANFGELKLLTSEEASANVRASSPGLLTTSGSSLSVPQQSMLMRSQSDHRLASQFARRDSRLTDLTTSQSRLTAPGYSDSEKDSRDSNRATSPSNYSRSRRDDGSRLGRYGTDDSRETRNRFLRDSTDSYRSSNWSRTDEEPFSSGPQFKSRFMRERGAELGFDDFDYDPSNYMPRSVRFEEPSATSAAPGSIPTPVVKVFDTPEAPRGCLSGIVKISDTAHYMERAHENEVRAKVEKERKEEETRSAPPPTTTPYQPPSRPRPPSRQVSEDEIEKQKKMNQAASSTTTNVTTTNYNSSATTPTTGLTSSVTNPSSNYTSSTTATSTPSSEANRSVSRRVGSLRDEDENRSTFRGSSDTSTTPSRRGIDSSTDLAEDDDVDVGESNLSRLGRRRRISTDESKDSSAASATSASTNTTGSSRSVRAPLAKNLPITEEQEEERDRDLTRKRGPKSSLVTAPSSSLGSSRFGEQTYNRNSETTPATARDEEDFTSRGNLVKPGLHGDEEGEDDDDNVDSDEVDEDEEQDEEEEVEDEIDVLEEEEDGDDDDESHDEGDRVMDHETTRRDSETRRGSLYNGERSLGGRRYSNLNSSTDSYESAINNLSTESRYSSPSSTSFTPSRSVLASGYSTGQPMKSSPSSSSGTPVTTNVNHQQYQQPSSSSTTDQTEKGRDNGLPCSVADLLNRSAQVRRDCIERRRRFFEFERPKSRDDSNDVDLNYSERPVRRTTPLQPPRRGQLKRYLDNAPRRLSDQLSQSSTSSTTTPSSPVDRLARRPVDLKTPGSRSKGRIRSIPKDRLERSIVRRSLEGQQGLSQPLVNTSSSSNPSPSYSSNTPTATSSSTFSSTQPGGLHETNRRTNSSPLGRHHRRGYIKARPSSDSAHSGFDPNRNSSSGRGATTSKTASSSFDRSKYNNHSSNYRSNPLTGLSSTINPSSAVHALASNSASTAPSSSHYSDLTSSRLSRSKSSHLLGVYSSGHDASDDDEDTSTPSVPTYRSRYAEANYGKEGRYQYRTRAGPKDREKSPVTHEDNSVSTSGPTAWSQYLRNKYGSSRNSSASSTGSGSRSTVNPGLSKSKSSHAVYLRTAGSDSSDDETDANTMANSQSSKSILTRKGSLDGSETASIGAAATAATVNSGSGDGRRPSYGYNLPRSTYLQKKRMMFKVGTRGTEPGCFTWPRGIACGPDNSIVVADSSNHRVQVFNSTGRFLHEFGSYGSAEGEFDCLAGVAVNRIGQFIVSDRYNHRVQIFDPSGRFLRSFGCEGRVDGRFSYPWGITTDSLGFIYICDKENHRIQVFQSDGTFVGKFGSIGNRPGLLEHPHYIAVSNTNRVIVSDSNNHRIQIFDVNGRSLSTFGCEGTEEGQFKFPRGIAVDDQGYIIVGDSGNNRIQIFNPDGTFLKAFGSWGSGEGEFKGLEGVAVSTTGNILVCDRENHRIQVF